MAVVAICRRGYFCTPVEECRNCSPADFFDSFHPVETADATTTKVCVICLDADSRAGIDALVEKAIAAGGKPGDTEDHGFMYGRSDLDGHSWQIMWMDPAAH